MTDVFISYKREERQKAEVIAKLLTQRGYQVWWDIDLLPGARFAQEIREIINSAKTAVVLWSKAAVNSPYVMDEATLARKRKILIPVRLDDCDLPIGFGGLHTLDLRAWQGDSNEDMLQPLLKAIEQRVQSPQQTPISEKQTIKSLKNSAAEVQFWREISEHEPQSSAEYALYLERYSENALFADIARLRFTQLTSLTKKDTKTSMKKIITITSAVVALITGIFTMFLKGGELMEYFGWVDEQSAITSKNETTTKEIITARKPITKDVTKEKTAPLTAAPKTPLKISTEVKQSDHSQQAITRKPYEQEALIPFALRGVKINIRHTQANKKQAKAIYDRLKNNKLDIKMTTLYSIPTNVANKIYYSHKHHDAAVWLNKTLSNTVFLELVPFKAQSDSDAKNIRIIIAPRVAAPSG